MCFLGSQYYTVKNLSQKKFHKTHNFEQCVSRYGMCHEQFKFRKNKFQSTPEIQNYYSIKGSIIVYTDINKTTNIGLN